MHAALVVHPENPQVLSRRVDDPGNPLGLLLDPVVEDEPRPVGRPARPVAVLAGDGREDSDLLRRDVHHGDLPALPVVRERDALSVGRDFRVVPLPEKNGLRAAHVGEPDLPLAFENHA